MNISEDCLIPLNVVDAMLIMTNIIESRIIDLSTQNELEDNTTKNYGILYANAMIKNSLIKAKDNTTNKN